MKGSLPIGQSFNSLQESIKNRENRKFLIGIIGFLLMLAAVIIIPFLLKYQQNLQQNADSKNQKFETASEKLLNKIAKNKIEVNDLTRQAEGIINNIKAHGENKEKTSKALASILEARKAKLVALMQDDPQLARESLFTDVYINLASQTSQDNVEKKISVTGTYSAYHIHAADGGAFDDPEGTKYFNVLAAGDNKYNLYGEQVDKIKSESVVKITGYALGNNILIESIDSQISPSVQGSSNPTTMKIAVIATKFTDTPFVYTMETVQNIFYADPTNNIIDYFKEASYGNLTITPSFYGIYTLPYTRGQGCSSNTLEKDIAAQADPDIDYSQFTRIMFIQDCPGYMASSFSSLVTQDGTFTNFKFVLGNSFSFQSVGSGPGSMPSVMSHEIAHTLPPDTTVLMHANYFNCTPDTFIPPSNLGQNFGTLCNHEEYGDTFDLLGQAGGFGHLNANYKYVAGWMSPANYPTVTSSGTYTIAPLETNSDAAQGLYIPRGTGGGAFNVEYRQPIGYDAKFADILKCPGCMVTSGPSIKFLPKVSGLRPDTKALDMTPNSPFTKNDYADGASLTPGKIFTDPEYGITIKTQTANSTGATVEVTVPAQSCTHNSPTATISPLSQSAIALEPKNYTITIRNNDSPSCAPTIFGISFDNNNFNLAYSADPSYLTLAAGASGTSMLTIAGRGAIADGHNFLSVSIISNAYGVPTLYTSGADYVLTSATDTTPPSAPANLTSTLLGSSQVKLDWTPSNDNLGVIGYNVFRDGYKMTVDTPSFIDMNLYPGITYSYYVQAFDRKGNTTNSQTITVTPPARTDFAAPSECTNLQETYPSANSITLAWSPSTDNVGVSMYHVLRNGSEIKRLPSSQTSFTDNLPQYNTMYTYYINVYDGDGGNNYCKFAFYTGTPGNIPPLHPTGLIVTNSEYFKTHLTWNANTESDISYYNVFRNDRKIGTSTQPSFDDYVTDNIGLSYFVQAVDQAGNRSAQSERGYVYVQPAPSGQPFPTIVNGSTPTIIPSLTPTNIPSATITPTPIPPTPTRTPTPIPPTLNPQDTTKPIVSITNPIAGSIVTVRSMVSITATAADNVGVTKVEFYINGALTCSDTTAAYTCTWKVPASKNKVYSISVKAYDSAGNNSQAGISVTAR